MDKLLASPSGTDDCNYSTVSFNGDGTVWASVPARALLTSCQVSPATPEDEESALREVQQACNSSGRQVLAELACKLGDRQVWRPDFAQSA